MYYTSNRRKYGIMVLDLMRALHTERDLLPGHIRLMFEMRSMLSGFRAKHMPLTYLCLRRARGPLKLGVEA
jgi:hypothetical protein